MSDVRSDAILRSPDGQIIVTASRVPADQIIVADDRDQGGECCDGSSGGCGEDGCTRSDTHAEGDR